MSAVTTPTRPSSLSILIRSVRRIGLRFIGTIDHVERQMRRSGVAVARSAGQPIVPIAKR
ncbi:hypothetical protein [Rosistilla carotiformis]|uniref:hypothetical protein n=1 Tax=Rosistilla carotiformis TaxID=2528017 RepID=UPI00119F7492|nr:hypothetical protein [Rosistilla carotiformis]